MSGSDVKKLSFHNLQSVLFTIDFTDCPMIWGAGSTLCIYISEYYSPAHPLDRFLLGERLYLSREQVYKELR